MLLHAVRAGFKTVWLRNGKEDEHESVFAGNGHRNDAVDERGRNCHRQSGTGQAGRARVEEGLAVYRGVPFAAPPVGDLRWRPPQPAAKWDGVRAADKFAPAVRAGRLRPAAERTQPPAMSEDCLYLNVWTPAK